MIWHKRELWMTPGCSRRAQAVGWLDREACTVAGTHRIAKLLK